MTTRRILIAAAAIVCGLTACGTSNPGLSAPQKSSAATTSAAATPAAGAPSACADVGGTVDVNQICHAQIAGTGYEVTFTFPIDYPDQQALARYLKQRRDDFIRYAAEDRPRTHPFELDAKAMAYQSGTPTMGTKSLVFEEYSDAGGAHPVNLYRAFNYDLGKRAPITLDTLFRPGINPAEVLDPILQRENQDFWDQHHDGVAEPNVIGAKIYENFALSNDAVLLFIDQGAWLPEVAGPRRVSIPRTELASALA